MGKVFSLATQKLHNQGDYSVSHRTAEGDAKYIAFKIWHKQAMDERDGIRKPADRPKPSTRPSGPPALRVVR